MSHQTGNEFKEILNHLLEGNRFKTPTKTDKDYYDELKTTLSYYLETLKTLNTSGTITSWLKDNHHHIEKSVYQLLAALEQYLSGNSGKAYQEIEQYFENEIIKSLLVELFVPLDNSYIYDHHIPEALYRVRQSATKLSKREEMFHVPFEKRHLVSNQRYSIAGVPCLYLGSSFFICWEELGRPSLNTLYISAFKTNNHSSINVLDLSFSLESLINNGLEDFFSSALNISEINKIKAYISVFPLVQSCSFIRKNSDGKFNAEYVIPNLVLQWISEKKNQIHGIKYRSTRVKDIKYCKQIHNFVFPPKRDEYQKDFFCEDLINSFCLTAPYSFEVLDVIEAVERSDKSGVEIEIEDGLKVSYAKTKFSEIENKILQYGQFEKICSRTKNKHE